MTDRTHRRGRARSRHTGAPRTPDPEAAGDGDWQALQRDAGNAAVSSILKVQRESEGGGSLLSMRPPAPAGPTSLVPRLTPDQLAAILAEDQARQDRLRPIVTRWLDAQQAWIGDQVRQGALSMPELVARIRDQVEGATKVPTIFLEEVVRRHLGAMAPPATRRNVTHAGVVSEIAAIISNVTSARIKVGTDRAGLSVGITGTARGTVPVGRATLGVEVTHKSVGVDLEFPFVGGSTGKAKGKISKDGAWELAVTLPLAGNKPIAAVPTAEAIGKSVREAEEVARAVVGLLERDDETDESAIQELVGRLGAALKDIQKVAAAKPSTSGPQLTVELGVQGGQRELPIAGDPVRLPEVRAGISVVLRF